MARSVRDGGGYLEIFGRDLFRLSPPSFARHRVELGSPARDTESLSRGTAFARRYRKEKSLSLLSLPLNTVRDGEVARSVRDGGGSLREASNARHSDDQH